MNLSQKLDILIGAKDEASKVLQGVRKSAGDALGEGSGMAGYAKGAGIAVAAVGAAALAAGTAAFAFTKSVMDANMQIITLAEKTGISADTLKQYTYVAEATEVSIDAIATGVKKLSTNMFEAATGNKEQEKLFKALGISVKDASGQLRSAENVMEDVADVFASITNETEKSALAVKLFGRSGTDIIPMLNQGSKGLQDLKNEAVALGVGMSDKTVKATLDFDAAMDKMNASLGAATDSFATELAPVMTGFINEVVIPSIPVVKEALVTVWGVARPAIELVGKALETVAPVIRVTGEALKMSAEGWKAMFGWANSAWESVSGSANASIVSIAQAADSLPAKVEPGFKQTKEAAHAQMEGIKTKWSGTTDSVLDTMAADAKKAKIEMPPIKVPSVDLPEARAVKEDIQAMLDEASKGVTFAIEPDVAEMNRKLTDGLNAEHGFLDSLTTSLSGGKWSEAWGGIAEKWGTDFLGPLGKKLEGAAMGIFGTGPGGQAVSAALSGAMKMGIDGAITYAANGFLGMFRDIRRMGFGDTSGADRAAAPSGAQGPGGLTPITEGITFGPSGGPSNANWGPVDLAWNRALVRASAANFSLEEGPTKTIIRQVLSDYPDSNADQVVDYISSMAGVPFRDGGWITRPTVAMMGEDSRKEFVVSNRGVRALEALNQGDVSSFIGGGAGGGSSIYVFNVSLSSPDMDGARRLIDGEFGDLILRRIRRESEAGREIVFNSGVTNPNLV